jgi:hypothetical protein
MREGRGPGDFRLMARVSGSVPPAKRRRSDDIEVMRVEGTVV